jgi:hypothetical protein
MIKRRKLKDSSIIYLTKNTNIDILKLLPMINPSHFAFRCCNLLTLTFHNQLENFQHLVFINVFVWHLWCHEMTQLFKKSNHNFNHVIPFGPFEFDSSTLNSLSTHDFMQHQMDNKFPNNKNFITWCKYWEICTNYKQQIFKNVIYRNMVLFFFIIGSNFCVNIAQFPY